jgi:hypothetical protein
MKRCARSSLGAQKLECEQSRMQETDYQTQEEKEDGLQQGRAKQTDR